jgi:hypothetical protein
MPKVFKAAAFSLFVAVLIISLTSGISYDGRNGGYKDMVEELYAQAVKQNSNLEAVEDGIAAFNKKKEEALEKYNSYLSYNNRYYNDARGHAKSIPDPATRQRAEELLRKSELRYRTALTGWENTINQLKEKEMQLQSLHSLLQLMVTEPIMEKYQVKELPGNSLLIQTTAELQQVIDKIKAITQ